MANSEPKVTWLLPVRNGVKFLPETLASIEAQTYTNWEVLAWDNGSTDGALEELRRWIPGRIRGRIVDTKPLPLADCLREMVLMADTELCARIDADDLSLPARLERQVGFLREHPEIALVGSRACLIDETGAVLGKYRLLPCTHDDILLYAMHANPIVHPAVLFRRSAVIAAGNYRHVGAVNVEDYDLWLRMALTFRVANLADELIQYRMHDESVTRRSDRQNELQAALNVRFCEHAPALYGISRENAMRLRTATHRRSFVLLCQAARHLSRTQGGTTLGRILSPWMHVSARQLTGGRDLFSRATFKLLRSVVPGTSEAALSKEFRWQSPTNGGRINSS